MRRIKDYIKMYTDTNELNMEGLRGIIPEFYLSEESENHVLEMLDNRSDSMIEGDRILGLGADLRAIYEIDNDTNSDNDTQYQIYRTVIRDLRFEIQEYLYPYEVFKSGYVTPIGTKQPVKLFKHLKKLGIAQKDIERITTAKAPDKQYLIISRNPVDYLFCATNQSFSSCLSLTSDYERAFYMGLPATMTDVNRFMVFTSTGKLRRYETKGFEFKHFNITSRSWGLFLEGDNLFIDRYYPHKTTDFVDLLRDIYPTLSISRDNSSLLKGVYSSKILKNEFEQRTHIYMDNASIVPDDKDETYTYLMEYNHDKMEGFLDSYFMKHEYTYYDGFDGLDSFHQLGAARHKCILCNMEHRSCDVTYSHNSYLDRCVCVKCIEKNYFMCYICGEWHSKYTGRNTFNGKCCNRCFYSHFSNCVHCNSVASKTGYRNYNDEILCWDCYSTVYKLCDYCCSIHPKDALYIDCNGGKVCNICISDLVRYELCPECNRFCRTSYFYSKNADYHDVCRECRDDTYRPTLRQRLDSISDSQIVSCSMEYEPTEMHYDTDTWTTLTTAPIMDRGR